jgi:hypothetical protein
MDIEVREGHEDAFCAVIALPEWMASLSGEGEARRDNASGISEIREFENFSMVDSGDE